MQTLRAGIHAGGLPGRGSAGPFNDRNLACSTRFQDATYAALALSIFKYSRINTVLSCQVRAVMMCPSMTCD